MDAPLSSAQARGEAAYNARAATPGYRDIFARWASDSLAVREQAVRVGRCRLDVPYGQDATETLDLFFPEGQAHGTLMYIHGGYWSSLDKSDASIVAPAFTQAGYVVAVVNYALCPQVGIGRIVAQMRLAATWLQERGHQWQANPDCLFVAGHSAGAHLAASLLVADCPDAGGELARIKGAICVSGLYDLRPLLDVPSVRDLTGLDPMQAQRLSPVLRQPGIDARVLTGLGTDENTGFHEQSALFAQHWGAHHAGHVLCAGRDHFTILDELTRHDGQIALAALRFMSVCREATS